MMSKQYKGFDYYASKLPRIMERMGAQLKDYDSGRRTCFVEFVYKGRHYRWENSVEELQARGIKITYGSDAFAITVLDLEALARMIERGSYDLLSGAVQGLRELPPSTSIPECFRVLQFDAIPSGPAEVSRRYKQLAKIAHPDSGGSEGQFVALQRAYEEAIRYFVEDK